MAFNYENLKYLKTLSSNAIKNIKSTIDSLVWDSVDYNNRAYELYEEGRYEESLFYYGEALKHEPDYITAMHGKGAVLCAQGKYEEAIICCNEILTIYPEEEEALNNKASILFKMKKFEASYLSYKAATDVTPENPIIWSNMGKVLFKLNRKDEAMSCWEVSIFLSNNLSWDDQLKYVFLGFLDSNSHFTILPRSFLINILQRLVGFSK